MDDFIKRRVAKKIQMRILSEKGEKFHDFDYPSKKLLKEVRSLPDKTSFDAVFSTFGDRVGVYRQKENAFLGIIIEDPTITNLFNTMFDLIWMYSTVIPYKK